MRKGFTLIELLIVIAIIAILALIAVPNFLEAQVRAKVSRAQADMRSFATAIEAYTVDWGTPPLALGSQHLYRWQMYSCFSWSLRTSGAIDDCMFSVTTPVAYLTTMPLDPFVDKTIMGDLAVKRGKTGYYYINVPGGYNASKTYSNWVGANNISGPSERFRFDGAGGKAYDTTWALMSPGPDRSMRDPRLTDGNSVNISQAMFYNGRWSDLTQGRTALYDASNGTISTGNIWRLSGGGPY